MRFKYWNKIANAYTSEDVILAIKYMLHDEFDAEYAVVCISPEHVSKRIGDLP